MQSSGVFSFRRAVFSPFLAVLLAISALVHLPLHRLAILACTTLEHKLNQQQPVSTALLVGFPLCFVVDLCLQANTVCQPARQARRVLVSALRVTSVARARPRHSSIRAQLGVFCSFCCCWMCSRWLICDSRAATIACRAQEHRPRVWQERIRTCLHSPRARLATLGSFLFLFVFCSLI